MKPHLKLLGSGKLVLLNEGISGLSEQQTRKRIRERHGSLRAFSIRFGLDYSALLLSLTPHSTKFAGRVADTRRMLGLPSNPTARNVSLALTHARRRGETLARAAS